MALERSLSLVVRIHSIVDIPPCQNLRRSSNISPGLPLPFLLRFFPISVGNNLGIMLSDLPFMLNISDHIQYPQEWKDYFLQLIWLCVSSSILKFGPDNLKKFVWIVWERETFTVNTWHTASLCHGLKYENVKVQLFTPSLNYLPWLYSLNYLPWHYFVLNSSLCIFCE